MALPFVRTSIHREILASTSDLARDLILSNEVVLPLLVRADRQTAGRGRGANTWWSDPGSLTYTLALDPLAYGLRVEHEPRLALASAVALIDAIGPLLPAASASRLGIRWPNDVEAAGHKLAGILPERVETAGGPRLLVGIGVNVRTRLDEAPPVIRRMATSAQALGAIGPTGIDLADAILFGFLGRFESTLEALALDLPALPDRWARLDTLLGRAVRVDLGPRIVEGTGAGIDHQGGLRLATGSETLTIWGGRVPRESEGPGTQPPP